jgi:hypothetical protein
MMKVHPKKIAAASQSRVRVESISVAAVPVACMSNVIVGAAPVELRGAEGTENSTSLASGFPQRQQYFDSSGTAAPHMAQNMDVIFPSATSLQTAT